MATDLRHTPVLGPEIGYPDLVARPDLATLTLLPWEPGMACCIADVGPVAEGSAVPADPRGAVRRAVAGYDALGLTPIVGPELEFFLCEPRPGRARRAAALRRQPEHGLHGRPAGRPARRRAPDHRVARRDGHGHVRRQPRVHELAVRDQPAPRARAGRGRPRVPAQVPRSRTSPRSTGSSRRSWASRSTTRAAPASTSTSAPTATATTRSSTAPTATASPASCAASPPACSPTRPR